MVLDTYINPVFSIFLGNKFKNRKAMTIKFEYEKCTKRPNVFITQFELVNFCTKELM